MRNHMKVVWGLFALLVAAFIAVPALAAPVFKTQGPDGGPASLTLLETQCSDPTVLKHLKNMVKPDFLDKLKNARLLWENKVWASCWFEYQGVVYSVDEEGTQLQPVERSRFKDNSI